MIYLFTSFNKSKSVIILKFTLTVRKRALKVLNVKKRVQIKLTSNISQNYQCFIYLFVLYTQICIATTLFI